MILKCGTCGSIDDTDLGAKCPACGKGVMMEETRQPNAPVQPKIIRSEEEAEKEFGPTDEEMTNYSLNRAYQQETRKLERIYARLQEQQMLVRD
jgi:hypothetical protein